MAIDNTPATTSIAENYTKYAEYFTTSSSDMVSVDTFFQLLLAEMSNQDPLEPTSNTEFISQLASFTTLQTASDNLYYNTVAYATSLAGKTVTVASTTGTGDLNIDTGVVTGVDLSDTESIEITVNGQRYPLSGVMVVNETESGTVNVSSAGSDGAYAVSLIGKKVTVAASLSTGTVVDEGVVESVEIENGEYRVVVNGLSYNVGNVVKVKNPDETGEETSPVAETSIMEENEDILELFS